MEEKWDFEKNTIFVNVKKEKIISFDELFLIYTIGYIISMIVIFCIIWFKAFFNGYVSTIDINVYHEAYPELFMHIFGIAGCIYFGYKKARDIDYMYGVLITISIIVGIIISLMYFF